MPLTTSTSDINMQMVMDTLLFKENKQTNKHTNERRNKTWFQIKTQWPTWEKNQTKQDTPPDWLYIPIRFQHSEATRTPKRERKLML